MGRAALAFIVALLAMATAVDARDARQGDVTSAQEPAANATATAPATPAKAAAPTPAVSPAPAVSTAAPKPKRSPPPKRLRLGPYMDPYGPVPVDRIFDVPHFETRVEVHGKAMDAAALTARMEWWMRDFEPLRGAVPRQGSAPSLAEMRDHRPHVQEGVNIVPVLDWLLDKLNKKD